MVRIDDANFKNLNFKLAHPIGYHWEMNERPRLRTHLIFYTAGTGAVVGIGLSLVFNGSADVRIHAINALITGCYFGVVGILIAIAERQRRARSTKSEIPKN